MIRILFVTIPPSMEGVGGGRNPHPEQWYKQSSFVPQLCGHIRGMAGGVRGPNAASATLP